MPRNCDREDVLAFQPQRQDNIPAADILLAEKLAAEAKDGRRYNLTPSQKIRVTWAMRYSVHIYFIYAEGTNLVKIGKSRRPMKRVKDMQVGSASPLRVLLSFRANHKTEVMLHELLRPHWSHGEWFRLDPPVLKVLEIAADHGNVGIFRLLGLIQGDPLTVQNDSGIPACESGAGAP